MTNGRVRCLCALPAVIWIIGKSQEREHSNECNTKQYEIRHQILDTDFEIVTNASAAQVRDIQHEGESIEGPGMKDANG